MVILQSKIDDVLTTAAAADDQIQNNATTVLTDVSQCIIKYIKSKYSTHRITFETCNNTSSIPLL